ncbi:S41 family peptidase [Streptomyces sp. NPDC017993]|uniref:S41 family peptidase n=1 Tax=Streptomyces sp. NPDC017993 TaxID=3365027 RepID=UPI00378E9E5B
MRTTRSGPDGRDKHAGRWFSTRSAASAGRLALVASLALASLSALPAPAEAALPTTGVWRTDGYGTVLVLDEDGMQEYQTTSVSCLKGLTAHRSDTAGGSGVRYVDVDGDGFTVRASGHRGRASGHWDGSPGVRHLQRIDRLPPRCQDPDPPRGRVAAFDVFWQTLEENYPFFAAKGINWRAMHDRYRPTVHEGMSDADFFDTLRTMVAPLADAHVTLDSDAGRFARIRPGTVLPSPDLDARVRAHVERHDLGGRKLTPHANGRIGYADLPGDLGYLRLSGFSGFSGENSFTANSAAFDKALGAVFTKERTTRLRGLVIDVRINGGGSDELGLRLAGRLTDRGYTAYAKRTRNDPRDAARFTRPQPQRVRPAEAPRFTGPVTVLTGGSTMSAGESFVQALINRPAKTVRIGQSTQGVFSDVLERVMPNGWEFGLPNEEFVTRSGSTFDGSGIPPHVKEPVFTKEEFARGRDSAFRRALAVLTESG